MKPQKKLTTATVRRRLNRIYDERRREMQRHAKVFEALDDQHMALRARCPHEQTHIESGHYMPCVEICDVCGAEVERC